MQQQIDVQPEISFKHIHELVGFELRLQQILDGH
jgi:hypothetical protein